MILFWCRDMTTGLSKLIRTLENDLGTFTYTLSILKICYFVDQEIYVPVIEADNSF